MGDRMQWKLKASWALSKPMITFSPLFYQFSENETKNHSVFLNIWGLVSIGLFFLCIENLERNDEKIVERDPP